jgi:hypothetical protein
MAGSDAGLDPVENGPEADSRKRQLLHCAGPIVAIAGDASVTIG